MDLEQIAVAVRWRRPWEAADLGFAMVRAWRRPIYLVWFSTVWPLALAVLLLCRELPWLAILLVWWLEPLFDRLVLAVVSRCFFGEQPGPWRILRSPGRYLGRGLLASLTVGRLSPWRSYLMPIAQLEGLGLAARLRRARVIGLEHRGAAFTLTALFLTFELGVFLGMGMLLVLLVPDELPAVNGFFTSLESTSFAYIGFGFILGVLTLLEPFYAAAGFALYINRRIHLEGWDVELGLRRMAERLRGLAEAAAAKRSRRPGVVAAALAAALLALAAAPATVTATLRPHASGPVAAAAALGGQDPQEVIQEVLAAPEFEEYETREVWKLRSESAEDEDEDALEVGALASFAKLLARLLFWAAIVLGAGLIAYLTFAVFRQLPGRMRRLPGSGSGPGPVRPNALFGLDLRPESLPADLLGAVQRSWEDGEPAAALSLLYRGALAHVVGLLAVDVPPGATEGECMAIVQGNLGPPLTDDFALLTRAWQLIAYARRAPSAEQFAALLGRWTSHLSGYR